MLELDFRGIVCPLNFVKARLALEKLPRGIDVQILLDLGEAQNSVPASLAEEGYTIISGEAEREAYRLQVKT